MTSRGSDGPPRCFCAAPGSKPPPASGHPTSAALLAMSLAFVTGSSLGQNWRLDEAVSVRETLSNNVNLTPNDGRRSDLITELIPSLHVTEKGARTTLSGFVAVPVVLYARTGGENNNAYPSANI